jgi:hypothetical protein
MLAGQVVSEKDQQQFAEAFAKVKSSFLQDWGPSIKAASRLSMSDMLTALAALNKFDRDLFVKSVLSLLPGRHVDARRIAFAGYVIDYHEIRDLQLPTDQANDAREFLGCTRLNDKEVQSIIDNSLREAKTAIDEKREGTEWAQLGGDKYKCCGVYKVAWTPILVQKRRKSPGASLIANLAAAAHYMLARFHVCAGLATVLQMKVVIESYDDRKRLAIATGDTKLNTIALTKGNPPFPPDFAIRSWAYKGATDGEVDRLRCNSSASPPIVFPDVSGSEA